MDLEEDLEVMEEEEEVKLFGYGILWYYMIELICPQLCGMDRRRLEEFSFV